MSFRILMQIANQAKVVGGESDPSLANAIFAYTLYFFFDHSLEEEDEGEGWSGWVGDLFLKTTDPHGFSRAETRDDLLVLFFKRVKEDGAEDFFDCMSMSPGHLTSLTVLQALKRKTVAEGKVNTLCRAVESNQTMDELWQQFFSAAGAFFTDPEDPNATGFERIMDDLLEPEVKKRVMKKLREHLLDFRV